MKIKKGDKVQVITGAYKGTIGEVTKVFPKEDKVIVEGVNLAKKASRVGYETKTDKKGNTEKVRVYKKTGAEVK